MTTDTARRPMTDAEMDLALSESGYGPVRWRATQPPLQTMPFEPAWYAAARSTPMCGIPADADRPDRGMQGLVLSIGIALPAFIAFVAFVATR